MQNLCATSPFESSLFSSCTRYTAATTSYTYIKAHDRAIKNSINSNQFDWPTFTSHISSNRPIFSHKEKHVCQNISMASNSWIICMQSCCIYSIIASNELDPKLFSTFSMGYWIKNGLYPVQKYAFQLSDGLDFIPPAKINHRSKAYLIPNWVFRI